VYGSNDGCHALGHRQVLLKKQYLACPLSQPGLMLRQAATFCLTFVIL